MTINIFDPDGEQITKYECEQVPAVDDKVRMDNGDYYIVNRRTWYPDLNSVALFCAYYGNIEI